MVKEIGGLVSTPWIVIESMVKEEPRERDDPSRYLGPAVQMGTAWYDRPDGTTDLERGAP